MKLKRLFFIDASERNNGERDLVGVFGGVRVGVVTLIHHTNPLRVEGNQHTVLARATVDGCVNLPMIAGIR